ncbi:MAG: hypothetical protein KC493_06375 [Bacteriovoracaceae bacterium]|nr:hypothetical protein [Bacteriovoracaceae bacterium]
MFGLTFCLMTLSIVILLIIKEIKINKEFLHHSNALLCLKNYVIQSNKYIRKIDLGNKAIEVAHVASLIPATAAKGRMAKKAAQLIQNITHVSYLKKIMSKSYCNSISKVQLGYKLIIKTKLRVLPRRSKVKGTIMWISKWKTRFHITYKKKVIDSFLLTREEKGLRKIKVQRELSQASHLWNLFVGHPSS